MSNTKLLALTLAAYLSILLVSWLLPGLVRSRFSRLASLKLVFFQAPFLSLNQIFRFSAKLGVLVLSFVFFSVLVRNFLGGSIKTEKTIIKTEELIDSPDKLLASKKVMVIFFDQLEMLAEAPDGSFLKQLYAKQRFIFTGEASRTNWDSLFSTGLDSYFMFGSDVHSLFFLAAVAPNANSFGQIAFVQPDYSYYENLNVFYLRRGLDAERKKFIHRR